MKSLGCGFGSDSWPHLGTSLGSTTVKRIRVRRVLAPHGANLVADGPCSIVASSAVDEEQVNVERPQRQRGRTTLTGDE